MSSPNSPPEAPKVVVSETAEAVAATQRSGRVYTMALDDDIKSRNAFAWAMTNYHREGDTVVLMHATKLDYVVAPGVFIPLGEEEEKLARQLLRKYARYCMLHNIDFDVQHMGGSPTEVMIDGVNASGSKCMILGNHGERTATQRWTQGSVSEFAAHAVPCPVVVVKQDHELTTEPVPSRRIAVAVDNSDEARAAFDWTLNDLYREGDTIQILHANPMKQSENDAGEGRRLMFNYSERCRERMIKFQAMHIHSSSTPSQALMNIIDTLNADILVVGSRARERGAITRALFGSVSDDLVRHCKCDLVVVKQQAHQ